MIIYCLDYVGEGDDVVEEVLVVDYLYLVYMVGEGLWYDVGEWGCSVVCYGSGLEFIVFILGGVDGGFYFEFLCYDCFVVEI